jgi:hypothetical protein
MAGNWQTIITPKTTDWDIPSSVPVELGNAKTNAASAVALAEGPTATHAMVADAEAKMNALKENMRDLKRRYFLEPPLTVTDFVSLGLKRPDKTRTPIPVPGAAPILDQVKALGSYSVEIRYHDEATPDSKARPYGYSGCVLNYAFAAAPITDHALLTNSALMTANPFTLSCGPENEGKYFCCSVQWGNEKGEKGPFSPIEHTVVS